MITDQNCLFDFVGLLNCPDQDSPDSGVYINSLPGISLESFERIATQDQINFIGVWRDVQNTAFIRFRNGFIAQMSKCFQLTKNCDYDQLICENREVLLNPWLYLLGNQFMMFRYNSNRLNKYTIIDTKKAEELITFYQLEYEAALEQAVQLVDRDACRCLQQGGQISHVWNLP